MPSLAGRVVGHDRLGAALNEEAAQSVAIVGGVGDQSSWRRQGADKRERDRGVAALTGRDLDGQGAARTIDGQMDLGGPATARAAYGLEAAPPLPPAADRCALTCELSSKSSAGGPPEAARAWKRGLSRRLSQYGASARFQAAGALFTARTCSR